MKTLTLMDIYKDRLRSIRVRDVYLTGARAIPNAVRTGFSPSFKPFKPSAGANLSPSELTA